MNRMISEQDISLTVHDFESMCLHISANKLTLTPKGSLGKIASFDLNSQMANPVPNAKNTYLMQKYPSITMYLTIALRSGLLEALPGAGQNAVLATTSSFAAFQQMSIYSKYLFVFLAWMRYIDADALYGGAIGLRWFDPDLIDFTFVQIAKTPAPGIIYRKKDTFRYDSEEEPLQYLMGRCVLFIQHLRDLGLVRYNEDDLEQNTPSWTVIKKLQIAELGVIISDACYARPFFLINSSGIEYNFWEDLDLGDYEDDIKQNPPGTPSFLKPFADCFPENEIDVDFINKLLFPQPRQEASDLVYTFRVSLGRNCYRDIICGGDDTFHDFHRTIQVAFNFDDDHLYSFFLSGKAWSQPRINSPYHDEPPFACDVLISDAGLREKQKILYLFDYGDCWRFDVKLLSVSKSSDIPENPRIVKSVGEAPEQYPSYDDDWDEDEDEDEN
jgi:hypothetical protein